MTFAQSAAQGWTQVQPQYRLNEKTQLAALVQWRWGRGNADQLLTDLNIHYHLAPVTLEAGVATLSATHPVFGKLESRPWLGVVHAVQSGSTHWVNRLRAELRFLSGAANAVVRLRCLTDITLAAINESGSLRPFVENEIFVHLNGSAGGPSSGMDQNRLRVGLKWQLNPSVRLDLSYLNLWFPRTPDDLVVHVPFLALAIDLNPPTASADKEE